MQDVCTELPWEVMMIMIIIIIITVPILILSGASSVVVSSAWNFSPHTHTHTHTHVRAHHVTSIALDCHPPPPPLAKPTVALSRGNVRGQVYVDAKVTVTLGHGKGQRHGDSWLISSLGRHLWVTAPNPPCGINSIFWLLSLSLSLSHTLFFSSDCHLDRSALCRMTRKGQFLKYS